MSLSPLGSNLALIFVFLRTAHPRMRMNVLFFFLRYDLRQLRGKFKTEISKL